MVHYSLGIKPGQQVVLQTSPLADELSLAFIEEATRAGGNVFVLNAVPGAAEIFLKNASDEQLDFISPVRELIYKTFDARMVIEAESNTRELSGVDPRRIARQRKANAPTFQIFMERTARKEMTWCLTVYPTEAMAQEANMSLSDYSEFVYGAGMLNEDDPVAFWKAKAKQQKLVDWLKGRNQVVLKGDNIDLSLSIKGRTFIPCAGDQNFPDGEIFTSPVEDSVNGWVRFKYPAIYDGQEIEDIELWFENGKVVKEKANRNQELLTALLNTDDGSRASSANGASAPTTASSASPRTCSSMRRSAAPSIWRWELGFEEAAARTIGSALGYVVRHGRVRDQGRRRTVLQEWTSCYLMVMVTEFFNAIKQGQVDEAKRLLALDPSLIHDKQDGLSPVLVAAYHKEADLANYLAERKVSLTIYEAAATGRTDNVIRILARDPQLVKLHAEDGFHPLGLACFFGHYETAKYLIKAGAAVNSASRNSLQVTPLHSAVAANVLEIRGSPDRQWRGSQYPRAGSIHPLHVAAQNGNLDIIRALIYGGADLNSAAMTENWLWIWRSTRTRKRQPSCFWRELPGEPEPGGPIPKTGTIPLNLCDFLFTSTYIKGSRLISTNNEEMQ